jgi:hypothetical protein
MKPALERTDSEVIEGRFIHFREDSYSPATRRMEKSYAKLAISMTPYSSMKGIELAISGVRGSLLNKVANSSD